MKYTLTFLALIFSCYIIQCFANPFDGLMDTQIKQDFSYNFPKPPEICDNGIDDDEDGYIDLFDTDCPCDIGSYQAACDNECFYTPQDNFSYDMELLWESERLTNLSISSNIKVNASFDIVAGDLENDGTVEIVSTFYNYESELFISGIKVFSGLDGSKKLEIPITVDSMDFREVRPSIADVNSDGIAEIFTISEDTLYCFSNEGNLLWKTESVNNILARNVQFADFNHDGQTEIYVGASVYNGLTGKILIDIPIVEPETPLLATRIYSIAADVLDDFGMELIIGNQVSSLVLNNLNDSIGNKAITTVAPFSTNYGFSSVGDMDGDNKLDVVVNDNVIFGSIYVWNPRLNEIITQFPCPTSYSGFPFLSDFNGDCYPDIGLVSPGLFTFENDGVGNFNPLFSDPSIISHDLVSSFDFNQDNKYEIIHALPFSLRIVDGETGATLSSVSTFNNNGSYKSNLVIDANSDNSANVITIAGSSQSNTIYKVLCYSYAETPWAPARSVWNQKGYHITNIKDDLSIPQYQQSMTTELLGFENCESEECPTPYNAFLTQATTRTQEGCFVWNATDFSIEILEYECLEDSLEFSLSIKNIGTTNVSECINFSSYLNAPTSDNLIQSILWCEDNVTSNPFQDTIFLKIPATSILDGVLYWTINDNGQGTIPLNYIAGLSVECDYSNNIDSLDFNNLSFLLDLGEDIVKCETDEVVLDAGGGFLSYEWQDGSTDSIFSTTTEGWYYVSVNNQCDQSITDSIFIENTDAISLNFGQNIALCPDELFMYTFDSNFESIEVYVDGDLYCTDCFEISLPIDTSISITAFVSSGACLAMDSLWVQPKEEIIIEEEISLCEGNFVTYYDSIIYEEGEYLLAINNCDSILNLSVELTEVDSIENSLFYCEGEIIPVGNQFVSSDTIIYIAIQNPAGCDSILINEIVFQTQGIIDETHEICANDSILIREEWYSEEGVFETILIEDNSCDSILVVTINHITVQESNEEIELCVNDSIYINGNWILSDTLIVQDFLTIEGCDSIHVVEIDFISRLSEIDTFYICEGDSVLVSGIFFSTEGQYEETYISQGECDSIYQFAVVKDSEVAEPVLNLDCSSLSYEISLELDDSWIVEWNSGEIGTQVYSNGNEILTASVISSNNCYYEYDVEVPEIPAFGDIVFPSSIKVESDETELVFIDVDTSLWEIQWFPENLVDCSNCFEVEVSPEENSILYAILTHESGCEMEYSITLTIKEPSIYFPTIFTPNDDGLNDIWYPMFEEGKFVKIHCSIYDKWGSEVYSNEEGEELKWDGMYRGQQVSSGVYTYIMDIAKDDGSLEKVYGTITITR